MLTRLACGVVVLSALGVGAASAGEFPEGTFASDREACEKLATHTPAELGEDLDFQVVSKKGLIAFQQVCDFVNVLPHDDTSFVATAFCNESGYTYPDLFSIKLKDGDRLNVTRVTDLTQAGPPDPEATDAPEFGETDAESAHQEGAAGEPEASAEDEEQPAESFSTFVKCQSVKP